MVVVVLSSLITIMLMDQLDNKSFFVLSPDIC